MSGDPHHQQQQPRIAPADEAAITHQPIHPMDMNPTNPVLPPSLPLLGSHQDQQDYQDENQSRKQAAGRQKFSPTEPEGLLEAREAFARPMVLSLDAGGVRGYWSLLVLKSLMLEVAIIERELDPENQSSFHPCPYPDNVTHCDIDPDNHALRYLPCHYFDLIVGSSTGALSAIMLGRLRMTVSDCMEEYKKLAGRIFANPKITLAGMIPVFGGVKYEGKGAAEAFEALCARRASKSSHCDNVLFKTPNNTCRTCVATCRLVPGSSYFVPLRSYTQRFPTSQPARPKILAELERICGYMQLWKVARAAIAASFIFRAVCIRLRTGSVLLSDGGMTEHNSPVLLALNEGQRLSPTLKPSGIGILVSVGTARRDRNVTPDADDDDNGKQFDAARRRNIPDIAMFFASRASDPEIPNEVVVERHQTPEPEFPFFRFNNHADVNHPPFPMDEWKPNKPSKRYGPPGSETLRKIEKNFSDWSSRPDVRKQIASCADRLVKMRRSRAKNLSLWERHAEVSTYTCLEHACGGPKFKFRHQFETHMDRHHGINGDELNDKIMKSKQRWEYCSEQDAHAWK